MKNTGNRISRAVLTLVVAGMGLTLTPRAASADFLDFEVDEDTVPGAPVGTGSIFVDKINGAYAERIWLGAGVFTVSLYVNFTQYLANEGLDPVNSDLGVIGGDADEYGLYALVTGSGTFSGTGSKNNPFLFDFLDADAHVWIDPDLDTTKTLPGALAPVGTPVTIGGGTADDYEVLHATTLITALSGGALRTILGGNFQLVFSDPTLTAAGMLYFPDLPLFGINAVNNGDFDDSNLSDGTLSGDVSLVFSPTVPEPATMTLLGLGLLGSAMAARRRRKV